MKQSDTSTVTVSSKGQMTVPAELRRQLKLQPGSRLLLTRDANGFLLRPLPSVAEVFASVRPLHRPEDMDQLLAQATEERAAAIVARLHWRR